MNSREGVQAVLAGEVPDQAPVCLHNSHLAASQAGISMARYRKNPKAIAQAHLRALERYGQDSLYLTIDTALLAEATGPSRNTATTNPLGLSSRRFRASMMSTASKWPIRRLMAGSQS